mgnify:CR=1 FL=1
MILYNLFINSIPIGRSRLDVPILDTTAIRIRIDTKTNECASICALSDYPLPILWMSVIDQLLGKLSMSTSRVYWLILEIAIPRRLYESQILYHLFHILSCHHTHPAHFIYCFLLFADLPKISSTSQIPVAAHRLKSGPSSFQPPYNTTVVMNHDRIKPRKPEMNFAISFMRYHLPFCFYF